MTFPTGWTQRFALTVDRTKVTGTPSGLVMLITRDMFPAANIDGGAASAQDGGGDIRVTTDLAGSNRLPIEVVDFHPDATAGNRRCEIWVNTSGAEPSSSVDTTYYVWCKGPTTMQQPAPSMPYGAEAVWSTQDYRAVHHGNNSALPEPYGLWLIRPKAVEFNGATYVTWLDANHGGTGNIRVAKYTHSTGLWTPAVTVVAAEMIDAHAAPSICVDTSGYIHVVWGGFSATNAVLKTAKSNNVGDIASWGSVVTVATGSVSDRTYPTMLCLSTGTLVLFAREADAWIRRVSTDNGATWGSAQTIITGTARSYTEWILGASDRVHVAWHTTASSGATNGLNGYYLYSDNPAAATSTWNAVDGTAASLPLASDGPTTVSTGRVFSTTGLGFNTSYLRGLAVSGSNAPMLSFDLFVTGTPASSLCSTFTYAAGTWTKVDVITGATVGLASSGSFTRAEGGVRFLTGTTWRILVGLTVSGFGEVQEWESTDGGATWAKAADVTAASTRGNWQPQYVRGTTGPLVATHFTTGPTNNGGTVFNSISNDIWCYGAHTDGVASVAKGAIPVTTYLRDSTRYHNDATATGSPSQTAGPATYGGYGQAVTGSNKYSIANNATISTELGASVHIQQWVKHNSAGAAEKTSCKNPGAGNSTPWVAYRDGSNNMSCFFGNGSAFIQPITSGGLAGTTAYRGVYQFGAGAGAVRLNKTAGSTPAMAGPLATVSDAVLIGETLVGIIDEFRIGPTRIGANTLDTEHENQHAPSTFASSSATALASNSVRNVIVMST